MGLLQKITTALTGDRLANARRDQEREFSEVDGQIPTTEELIRYIDPQDPMPDVDCQKERVHFPDELSDRDVDTLLESFRTPHWVQYGRPEEPEETDPDVDPFNFDQSLGEDQEE